MGRDTTANKRMAAKRSREKEAGLRRLNVALRPEVFCKFSELLKQLNCTSQAGLIELLVMESSSEPYRKAKESRNEVTARKVKAKRTAPSKKQEQKTKKKASSTKAQKDKMKVAAKQKELSSSQMSLFEM
jgi:hypothetical protein